MNLIRETRGLFLSWSRLERPRPCATGLSPSTRWAVCITSEKQMCIWYLCFSFPKRIQSWELPSTDLRSHLQLWLDYVSTQTVNTMKSGGLNRFIIGGQAVFKPLCFWLQFFCFNQTKMCPVPIFSSLSASSYFPAQLEVFPLPLNLTPSFSSLPQWLRSHVWFCFQSSPEPCMHSLSLLETLSSGLDLSQETQNSKSKTTVFFLLPFRPLPLLN